MNLNSGWNSVYKNYKKLLKKSSLINKEIVGGSCLARIDTFLQTAGARRSELRE